MMKLSKSIVYLISIISSCEIISRTTRLTDIPLYDKSPIFGYIPKPNQNGNFMWLHDWHFNDISMGTKRPSSLISHNDVILIGDSLVMGNNTTSQSKRLGNFTEQVIHRPVWPIGSGSWGLQNELTYAAFYNKQVNKFRNIVLILNPDDFGKPSVWRYNYTHPIRTGPSNAFYLFERTIIHQDIANYGVGFQLEPLDLKRLFNRFASIHRKNLVVILYGKSSNLGDTNCSWAPVWIRASKIVTYCLAKDRLWNNKMYIDDGFHPAEAGNKRLAEVISGLIS